MSPFFRLLRRTRPFFQRLKASVPILSIRCSATAIKWRKRCCVLTLSERFCALIGLFETRSEAELTRLFRGGSVAEVGPLHRLIDSPTVHPSSYSSSPESVHASKSGRCTRSPFVVADSICFSLIKNGMSKKAAADLLCPRVSRGSAGRPEASHALAAPPASGEVCGDQTGNCSRIH